MSDVKVKADKYIRADGSPPPEAKVLYLTSRELGWLKTAILRGGYMPYFTRDRVDAPTPRKLKLMSASGLVSGPPWRITSFGREAVKRHQPPTYVFIDPPAYSTVEISKIAVIKTLAEAQREAILAALNHCGGKKSEAAKVLGTSVRNLRNKVKLYAAKGRS